jgi:hypothetical protein
MVANHHIRQEELPLFCSGKRFTRVFQRIPTHMAPIAASAASIAR